MGSTSNFSADELCAIIREVKCGAIGKIHLKIGDFSFEADTNPLPIKPEITETQANTQQIADEEMSSEAKDNLIAQQNDELMNELKYLEPDKYEDLIAENILRTTDDGANLDAD